MVREEILIDASADSWRAAILREGKLDDLIVARADGKGVEGDIYLGRVVRVLPGMGGAFVEVGLERPVLMEIGRKPPREGEIVIVQLVEPPSGTKAARVSRRIAIAGSLLVLLPGDDGLALPKNRKGAAPPLKALRAARQAGEGIIVRTAALDAAEQLLVAELAKLRARWKAIVARRDAASPPATLEQMPPARRLAAALVSFAGASIVVDRATTARALAAAAPELADHIEIDKERSHPFARADVADAIAELETATVALPSGGALTIEPTSALTSIDVDSGTATGARLRLTTDLEAARELARQLRLRDITGAIVVDFIRLDAHLDRTRLLEELRRAVGPDRRAVEVLGFTKAGHVELLRSRRGTGEGR